ncbi:Autophagy-related protein 3 [Acorus gramineus]|uniref:Autophagy-related protein 3 n=1 Tax=Acorus gramineus TaxID=55184 RepID=A0AAV8ZY72_ACOGR|nr:Autophagy-related protein 3 [Acorus gramineus]
MAEDAKLSIHQMMRKEYRRDILSIHTSWGKSIGRHTEDHPYLQGKHASIHPCKHARVMKKIVEVILSRGVETRSRQTVITYLALKRLAHGRALWRAVEVTTCGGGEPTCRGDPRRRADEVTTCGGGNPICRGDSRRYAEGPIVRFKTGFGSPDRCVC